MKAYHILLFMFIFNMFIWLLTILNIYDLSIYANPSFQPTNNPTQIESYLTSLDFFGIEYSGISLIVTALVAGSIVSYFTRTKTSQGVVYGLFSSVFWATYLRTLTVLNNIAKDVPYLPMMLSVITIATGIIFVAGLLQMVTGGWKSYE